MPLAFVASSDEDPDVAALWKDVWAESASSQSAAARLYMSEILAMLLEGKRSHPLLNHRCLVYLKSLGIFKVGANPLLSPCIHTGD